MPVDLPASTVLPYGLLSVVEPLTVASSHWQGGVQWQSRCLDPDVASVTYDECVAVTGTASPPAPPAKEGNVVFDDRAATAFTTYLEVDCSAVGAGDLEAWVRQAYTAAEPRLVERVLWNGRAVNDAEIAFPHLAADGQVVDADDNLLQTVPVTGGPFNPADALGFVEDQLAQCSGSTGVIHVPRRALPAFSGMMTANGGRLKTLGGNSVAAGTGYVGTSPGGSDAGTSKAWIYGTGQVFGVWGDIKVLGMPGSLDRVTNTQKVILERTYLFAWDCCHVGVLVDLSKVV
jgi:hypothetical protein